MSVSDRIKLLVEKEGSPTSFAKKTQLNRSSVNNIVSKGGDVRSSTLLAIAQAYPNINLRWLIVGEGTMWLDDKALSKTELEEQEVRHLEEKVNLLKGQVMELLETKKLNEDQIKKLWALIDEYKEKIK